MSQVAVLPLRGAGELHAADLGRRVLRPRDAVLSSGTPAADAITGSLAAAATSWLPATCTHGLPWAIIAMHPIGE